MKCLTFACTLCLLAVLAAPAFAAGPLPKVAILGTGGTISGGAKSSTQVTDYRSGQLTAQQIIDSVPGLEKFATITAEQVANVSSTDIKIADCLKIARRVNELLAGDTDGVVITHGTSTQEETSYFLNLVIKSGKPVVTVGAMRPATAISADGPLNLLQAVAVAGNKDAAGRGVLMILNGEINSARDSTKTNTMQVQTFQSSDFGFLGYVIDNKPAFYRQTTRKHTVNSEFDVSKLTSLPKVHIIYGYLDNDPDVLKSMIDSKPAGIVVAAGGNGAISRVYRDQLAEAAKKGIVVVRSSHTGSGVVTKEGRDENLGFVASDSLNPQKARMLLMLALTKTKDRKEIQRMFDTY